MIIVLLLFFQSICLYCQRLVLYVYDRWINPRNARIVREAAELTGNRRWFHQRRTPETTHNSSNNYNNNNNYNNHNNNHHSQKRLKKRYATIPSGSASSANVLAENCRFCANCPQGYCRHHFHLQELEIQRQQERKNSWNPLSARETEYRRWRNANRELKRNLKNRYYSTQQYQQVQNQQFLLQQKLRKQQPQQQQKENASENFDSQFPFDANSFTDSGYQSNSVTTNFNESDGSSLSVATASTDSTSVSYEYASIDSNLYMDIEYQSISSAGISNSNSQASASSNFDEVDAYYSTIPSPPPQSQKPSILAPPVLYLKPHLATTTTLATTHL